MCLKIIFYTAIIGAHSRNTPIRDDHYTSKTKQRSSAELRQKFYLSLFFARTFSSGLRTQTRGVFDGVIWRNSRREWNMREYILQKISNQSVHEHENWFSSLSRFALSSSTSRWISRRVRNSNVRICCFSGWLVWCGSCNYVNVNVTQGQHCLKDFFFYLCYFCYFSSAASRHFQ